MKRIIMHWTAGAPGVNPKEAASYHFIIGHPDGKITAGVPVEKNIPPLVNGAYAAHTRNLNSWSIGVALDAMAGARERPFSPGKYPITHQQVAALVKLVAELAEKYKIPVTRQKILTHAEVERTLGVKQRNKWDITWLPGMTEVGDPIQVGDRLRKMISEQRILSAKAAVGAPSRRFLGLFGRKNGD